MVETDEVKAMNDMSQVLHIADRYMEHTTPSTGELLFLIEKKIQDMTFLDSQEFKIPEQLVIFNIGAGRR